MNYPKVVCDWCGEELVVTVHDFKKKVTDICVIPCSRCRELMVGTDAQDIEYMSRKLEEAEKKQMTVLEILTTYLMDNGYDGLCHRGAECGCGLDDLQCCDGWCMECVPAYKWSDGNCYDQKENRQRKDYVL